MKYAHWTALTLPRTIPNFIHMHFNVQHHPHGLNVWKFGFDLQTREICTPIIRKCIKRFSPRPCCSCVLRRAPFLRHTEYESFWSPDATGARHTVSHVLFVRASVRNTCSKGQRLPIPQVIDFRGPSRYPFSQTRQRNPYTPLFCATDSQRYLVREQDGGGKGT